MIPQEFNLSKKIIRDIHLRDLRCNMLPVPKVKEFIKKLKEDYDTDGIYITLTVVELDKLVGDDLK